MNPDEVNYIRHWLSRSGDTLNEAEHLLNGGFTAGVVNRIYYACFYAVSALLFSEAQSSSKHSGVIYLFDRHWIKHGRLPAESGAFYHLMSEKRQRVDYEDLFSLDHSDVESWVEEARVFVQQVRNCLKDNAGIETE